jgi:hemolysin activation/secretion protein
VSWTGGFEYKTIDNTALNMPSTRDDLRIFHTGFNVDERDPYGRTFIVNDFAFGVTEFGASDKNDPRLSRSGGGANFFKYSGALNRVHPVYDGTILYLKGSAQFTPDYLVAAEQFDIGGVYSVRGYPQSDYLGDYGGGGSAEIRVPLYFVPRDITIPVARVPVWNSVKLVAFFDGAYAKTRNPDPGIDPSRTFFGVGGGVRIDLPNNFTARFEWATPTGDRPSDRSGSQFYFSISGEFF